MGRAGWISLFLLLLLGSPGRGWPDSSEIFSTSFTGGAEGWSYSDNEFRGATQSSYASGPYLSSGGFSGGGIRVRLGNSSGFPLFQAASGG